VKQQPSSFIVSSHLRQVLDAIVGGGGLTKHRWVLFSSPHSSNYLLLSLKILHLVAQLSAAIICKKVHQLETFVSLMMVVAMLASSFAEVRCQVMVHNDFASFVLLVSCFNARTFIMFIKRFWSSTKRKRTLLTLHHFIPHQYCNSFL
jgi:uncharacterized membrane protein YfcA